MLRPISRPTRLLLTVPEAGERCGLGQSQAYAAAKRGELPTVTINGRKWVPAAVLEQVLYQQGVASLRPDVRALLTTS